ncbi:MAG: class A beta-lactamase-related serine hydrolase [Candidatus Kapabacteria bacterium]|nr:class A beta-lactamase-related serine hydrolase [Candidatus Kapabacteria bacterium]
MQFSSHLPQRLIKPSIVSMIVLCSVLAGKPEMFAQTKSKDSSKLPSAVATPKNTTLLDSLMRTEPQHFSAILANEQKHRVQILYTQIDRDKRNRPVFRSFAYRLDPKEYFYPASTTKLPSALLALEKMNRLGLKNKYLPMTIDSTRPDQHPVTGDVTSADGHASVAHFIKKIFLVSDNDAHNRLLEFITPDTLNAALHRKGYTDAKINRRLGIGSSPEQDSYMNPLRVLDASGKRVVYAQAGTSPTMKYDFALRDLKQGKGVMRRGALVNEPIDFTESNYISIETLQRILRAALFPEVLAPEERFGLTAEDYDLVYSSMAKFPRESRFPKYDTTEYWDSYVKFAMFGDVKTPMPKHIRIFNKVGDAYGYLLENAYVVDFQKKIEFFVTAVIYANEDGVFNDEKYEYETVSFPFMANLGKLLYKHETSRKRTNTPNLAKFAKYQSFPPLEKQTR